MATYGVVLPILGKQNEKAAAGLSLAVQQILQPFIGMVHFWDNEDAQKQAMPDWEKRKDRLEISLI